NAPEGSAKVLISGWIRNDVRIPRDSRVWINTLGLLGEKYLEIMPGKNYADLVKKGDNMAGIDPMASHEIVDVIRNMVADVDQTFVRINNKEGTVGKLLFDDTLYNQMVSTTKELQTSITTLTQGFDGLISDIRAHPWKLFFRDKEKPQKR
ncbi:MAG: hypothetical protein ACM3IL_02260, partial [Deltaproteobacteria bacterium]